MNPPMKCPACEASMRTTTSTDVEVEVCPTCSGLWLDAGEFDTLVAARFAGMDFEDLLALSKIEPLEPRICPRDQTFMDAVFFQELELDRCSTCAGVFLDGDDRAQLRARAEHRRDVQRVHERQTEKPETRQLASISELDEIELETIVPNTATRIVQCGGCGARAQESRCIKRIDAFWCEECVIRGDYPGGYGETIANRMAKAAQSLARAEAKQKSAMQARDLRASNKDRITINRKGRAVRGAWTYEEYVLAFQRAGDSIRDFLGQFRRDKKD